MPYKDVEKRRADMSNWTYSKWEVFLEANRLKPLNVKKWTRQAQVNLAEQVKKI